MKAYQAKSITYDTESPRFTKTTPPGTGQIFLLTMSSPIYTVPVGRTAKIQYLDMIIESPTLQADGITPATHSGTATFRFKINNNDATNAGRFLVTSGVTSYGFNAIDSTSPTNIYLSAGDSIYVKYTATYGTGAYSYVGDYIIVYPSFFMSIIEEYEA